MESVSVAKLKSKLSHYLNMVKKGSEIVVTSHRHPIARLAPLEKRRSALEILPAKTPVSSLKKIRGIKLNVDPVAYLLADRRRR
jgi:prevent-host-death family protein